MPYIDQNWIASTNETVLKGTWVPETRLDAWTARGRELPLRAIWTVVDGPSPEHVARFDALDKTEQMKYLGVFGADIASVQRDQLFYSNALERLKNNPSDEVADQVVDNLKDLGFISIQMPAAVGGPPPHESPRPARKVLDWLLRQLAKCGRFLLNAVAFLTTRLADLGLSAVTLQVGPAFAVGIEFPPNLFRDPPRWAAARQFVDGFLTDMGDKVFGP